MSASIETLCRRACYGGRKGRSALRRLKAHNAPELEAAANAYFDQFFNALDLLGEKLREVATRMPELQATLDQLSSRLATQAGSLDRSKTE